MAETPVVVEVPHASVRVDPESLATLAAPARSIGQDADLYVDELYAHAPDLGATLLVAEMSRYVCDLNRSESDVDGLAVQGAVSRNVPHGLIWRSTTENQPALHGPLETAEFRRRLSLFYHPYHQTLSELVERKLQLFGFAILLSGHSMPSQGRRGHGDAGRVRADVVPGTRGRTTAAPEVIATPDRLARERGWTVAHDDPYRGGFTTGHHGRPAEGRHAVQVELSRRLYMDERNLVKKTREFADTQAFCDALVADLGGLALR